MARPVADNVVPASYLTMQTRNDGAARPGIRSYIKSGMIQEFTPALIDTMLEAFEPGRGVAVNSFATGGQIAQVADTATAWPHRKAHSMIAAVSFWSEAGLDEARIASTRALCAQIDQLAIPEATTRTSRPTKSKSPEILDPLTSGWCRSRTATIPGTFSDATATSSRRVRMLLRDARTMHGMDILKMVARVG